MCILEPGVTLAYSVNFWEIRSHLKTMFLHLMSIECVHDCSDVDWVSLRIRPQPFSQCRIFSLSQLEIHLQIQQQSKMWALTSGKRQNLQSNKHKSSKQ